MNGECEFCRGRGYLCVEPNSSLTYPCPDCVEHEDDWNSIHDAEEDEG